MKLRYGDASRFQLAYRVILLGYIVGGFFAIALSVLYGFNRAQIGFAFLVGGILSFAVVTRDWIDCDSYEASPTRRTSNFVTMGFILWMLLIVISIILYRFSSGRYYTPIGCFVTTSVAATVIAAQVLMPRRLSRREIHVILSEIMILSILVGAMSLLLFSQPYGNDAGYHAGFIESIVSSGTINNYPDGNYQNYPVYHIMFASLELTVGIDLKTAELAAVVLQVLFTLFVFSLARSHTNTRVALMSMLIVTLSPELIRPRYELFPSSFAVIFLILLVFLLLRPGLMSATRSMLLLLTLVLIVLTHPLIPVIAFVIIIMIYSISRFLRVRHAQITLAPVLLTLLLTFTSWMRPVGMHGDLISTMVVSLRSALGSTDYAASINQVTLSSRYGWFDVMLYDMGFTILIALGSMGAFIALSRCRVGNPLHHVNGKFCILSLATLLIIPIPFVLALAYPQSLPSRWFPIIEVCAGIFAGSTIAFLGARMKRSITRSFLIVVVGLLIFFMISSPVANPNSHIYSTEIVNRSAVTQSEFAAAEFINGLHASQVSASWKYFSMNVTDHINPDDPSTYSSGLIVIRDYDLAKGFIVNSISANLTDIVRPNQQLFQFLNNTNQILDIGTAKGYLPNI